MQFLVGAADEEAITLDVILAVLDKYRHYLDFYAAMQLKYLLDACPEKHLEVWDQEWEDEDDSVPPGSPYGVPQALGTDEEFVDEDAYNSQNDLTNHFGVPLVGWHK